MTAIVMKREGSFKVSDFTEEQCKVKGHTNYSYTWWIAYQSFDSMNNKGILIYHEELDNMVTNHKWKGTCEQMLKSFHVKIAHVKNIVASRFTIKPEGADVKAYMSVYVGDSSLFQLFQ